MKTASLPIILILFVSMFNCSLFTPPAANIQMPSVFGDHMVLQQGKDIPIWGTADPGGKVQVELNHSKTTTVSQDNGQWSLHLPKMDAGGPYTIQVIGQDTLLFKNVMIGEVWVCSGQSNMQWSVERSQNAEQEISNADYPNIRLFQVALNASAKPLDDVEGEWQVCSPQSVPSFSAVGYFFGQELYHKTDIAIGLIQSAWGGTPAESWTTTESMKADRVLAPIVNTWDTFLQDYPDYVENFAQYHDKYQDEYRKVILNEWRKQAEQAREQGLEPPPRPKYPGHKDTPQVLYNAMIAPLIPYAIQGAIWYQGESNANRAFQYRSLFPTLIRDWRAAWDQDDFPFYFVQLANYRAIQTKPVEFDPWPELREAQLMTLEKVKNTGMAVIIDIGEADDIHPKNKQDVGQRLARWALAECYDQDVVKSGPIFKSVKFENDKAILSFDYVDGGLMTSNNEPLKGFAIAGADSEFVWAEAKIQGDQIIAWHPSVDQPISVRYAWANNPVCNLYNKAGLPASPFRTEDWPAVTRNDLKP